MSEKEIAANLAELENLVSGLPGAKEKLDASMFSHAKERELTREEIEIVHGLGANLDKTLKDLAAEVNSWHKEIAKLSEDPRTKSGAGK